MDGATSRQAHEPVLLARCLALLAPCLSGADAVRPDPVRPERTAPGELAAPVVLDTTVGLGGHAEALLAAFPGCRLIGLDRDPVALAHSRTRLSAAYGSRWALVHAVYDTLPDVLAEQNLRTVSGILFDLGVSSMQLDQRERGFAYSFDAPLDMRMDPTGGRTAEDVVNGYSAPDLARVLREYGEERFAGRIAAAIVRERAATPLRSTTRLADLVRDAIPAATRRTGGHPAKRTFQALRIEVNGELAALRSALPAALAALAVGGRIVVLSYHSLEDRIVKRAFASAATDRTPPDMPIPLPAAAPTLRLLVRGAERAGPEEVAANPRAASVRLRAAERIAA